MITKRNEVSSFTLAAGITSKVLANNNTLMIVENTFLQGAIAPTHQHVNEQVGYVLSGCFELVIEGNSQILRSGDSFLVEKNIPHSCGALEGGIILDIFSPRRDDILKLSNANK